MKKRGLLITVLMTGMLLVKAQAPDSLDYYAQHLDDTVTINRLINLCFLNRDAQASRCISYSQLALEASRRQNFPIGEARSLINIGSAETIRGNYAVALQNYFDAIGIWEKINNARGILLAKNNIAEVYGYLKKPGLQFQYLSEARSMALQHNMRDELALINQNFSVYYAGKADFRSAFNSQMEAVKSFTEQGKLNEASSGYSNAGAYQFYMNRLDSALYYYRQAEQLSRQTGDTRSLSMSMANMAEVFENQGNTAAAIAMYDSCIRLSKAPHFNENLRFCYAQLAGIYQKKGDLGKTIGYIKLEQATKDSIFNIASSKQINELQVSYETAKKEKQIQEQQFALTKKNYWIMGISALLLLGGLLAYYIHRANKLRQAKQLQSEIMKQQELAAKAVIAAEENERQRIARDLHDGIGQTLSAAKMNLSGVESRLPFASEADKLAFEKIISLVDESCKEVRNVSHAMMPNVLLKSGLGSAVKDFVEKIDGALLKINLYTEGLNQRIDTSTETVLYRIIQECVNNVIKHSGANSLDISLVKDADAIAVTIEDNGKGFDTALLQNGAGMGLRNISSRVQYLNGTVDFDSAPGKGTLVAIHVPLA